MDRSVVSDTHNMKGNPRDRLVVVRATDDEVAIWKTAARLKGLSLAAFIRATLYDELSFSPR